MKTLAVLVLASAVVAIASAEFDFHPNFVHKPMPDGRIVGGKDADIADFKYQVSMQLDGQHVCGGAVIAANWVITAAHCLQGYIRPSSISFRIGSPIHYRYGKVVRASQFFNHPLFNEQTMNYDVALVRTQQTLVAPNVAVIGIPKVNTPVPAGKPAIVSGWGYLRENGYTLPSNLQYVIVNVVDQNVCKRQLSIYGQIHDSMFCAAAPRKDSCQGDSGGPIVIDGTLTGVVSWGIGCADPKFSGVYCRLANPTVREWIRKISNI